MPSSYHSATWHTVFFISSGAEVVAMAEFGLMLAIVIRLQVLFSILAISANILCVPLIWNTKQKKFEKEDLQHSSSPSSDCFWLKWSNVSDIRQSRPRFISLNYQNMFWVDTFQKYNLGLNWLSDVLASDWSVPGQCWLLIGRATLGSSLLLSCHETLGRELDSPSPPADLELPKSSDLIS